MFLFFYFGLKNHHFYGEGMGDLFGHCFSTFLKVNMNK